MPNNRKSKILKEPINKSSVKKNGPLLTNKIEFEQTLTRVSNSIKDWQNALNAAENFNFPNREFLLRIYKNTLNDTHLKSCIQSRQNAILSKNYQVTKNGKVNEEKTKLIQAKWFYDFLKLCLDSQLYGANLIRFGDFNGDEFEFVKVPCERQYIKFEINSIVSSPALMEGESWLQDKYKKWYICVGDPRDQGLLNLVTPLCTWKRGAQGSWSNYSESYGVPIRVGKTSGIDEATTREMELMLKNLNGSGYALIKPEDSIEIVETKTRDAYKVFQFLTQMCNDEMSKLILGSTSMSDPKSFVGSAEVHERVFQTIEETDEIFIANILKYQLIPLLNMHGFNLGAGFKIEAEVDDSMSLQEKSAFDLEILTSKDCIYTLPEDYILQTYGSPVIKKTIEPTTEDNSAIANE